MLLWCLVSVIKRTTPAQRKLSFEIENSSFHPNIHYHPHHHHKYLNRKWKHGQQAWCCIFSSALGSLYLVSATGDTPEPPTCLTLISHHLYLRSPFKTCHDFMTRVDPYERPDEWHVGQSEVSKKQRTWLMLTSIETYTCLHLYTPLFTAINKPNIVFCPRKNG